MIPRFLSILLALALAACSPTPDPARPAFWQVTGPHGEKGWLLGTIHALPRPADWRSPVIDKALGEATVVAVEVAEQGADVARLFDLLERTPGLPPLSARVDPSLRSALALQLQLAHTSESAFADTESWAAALRLARAGQDSGDSANGIDRAVLQAGKGKQIAELEGAEGQLRLFDAMPEPLQRRMLNAVLREAAGGSPDLTEAWRKGDFARIEAETRTGLLADPALREVLFTGRNRAWAENIAAQLAQGERVFVAVGAAHMAGADGLAAMLAARGFHIARVQ